MKNLSPMKLMLLCGLLLTTIMNSCTCQYAKANQKVVVSEDCGQTWKEVKAGDAVPKEGFNKCYMKVAMPNYPMQGQSIFVANFAYKVRVNVHIDYDYSITDPLSFIKQAKALGKANADADDDGILDPSAFEGAENSVIDVRIKDVAKSVTTTEDIIDMDQTALEVHFLEKANEVLKPMGVQLNFITLTFDYDEQTRQAIDVLTAMRIYETREMGELGRQVISSRAGANKIIINERAPADK